MFMNKNGAKIQQTKKKLCDSNRDHFIKRQTP